VENVVPHAGFLLLLAGICAARVAEAGDADALPVAPLRWAADAEGGAPYICKDPSDPNRYVGFEVDLAAALERQLGRRIQFVQYDFKSLVSDLQRGARARLIFPKNHLSLAKMARPGDRGQPLESGRPDQQCS
jgi:ABC-type amino acid transport substrate-binding protein